MSNVYTRWSSAILCLKAGCRHKVKNAFFYSPNTDAKLDVWDTYPPQDTLSRFRVLEYGFLEFGIAP